MRKLAVLSFVTLDGVMQSPSAPQEDPSGGFAEGGWAAPYWDGVMGHVFKTAMATPYDILFGRKTYDIFAGHWPDAPKSEASDLLNAATKYVVTSRPGPLDWANAHAVPGNDMTAVRDLKDMDGPLLQVHGSATLIQSLLADDLVDEFRIWTFPVVTGPGKRLFGPESRSRTFLRTHVQPLANGVTHQILVPA
ncbi:MAG: dihydrofolate reductase family protein [Pseudomonadota bacterium]